MANITNDDARAELVRTLVEKVQDDPYPSNTMLDMLEELLTPEELPAYVVMLQDRIRADNFPSIPMLKRLKKLI